MRYSLTATIAVLALSLAAAPVARAGDAVSSCAAFQLKAYAALYQAIIKEATKACVAGSAGSPAPLDTAKLVAATDKFNAQAQQGVDKFAQVNCFVDTSTPADSANVINTSQGVANSLCLVP